MIKSTFKIAVTEFQARNITLPLFFLKRHSGSSVALQLKLTTRTPRICEHDHLTDQAAVMWQRQHHRTDTPSPNFLTMQREDAEF
ncbi:hypothetical protein TNCV_2784901 [Trichonephila clavipes]|nr:hypothetical protein TNCV_2784901 [Trichonephila clavipes]